MALTLDDIKKMPPKRKALLVGVIYLLLAAVYFSMFMQPSLEKKLALQTKLAELQNQVTEKARLAAKKNMYIRELKERQQALNLALTRLPDQKEIPGLLYAVAQAGTDTGINFVLFEPKPVEITSPDKDKKTPATGPANKKTGAKDADEKFYDEIPVNVSVVGGFHSTATFFEKVAKLPRIINIEDIVMKGPEGNTSKVPGNRISTSCVIKTYMFLEKKGEKKEDEKK
jgi:type IV pilus assembly protein PilO